MQLANWNQFSVLTKTPDVLFSHKLPWKILGLRFGSFRSSDFLVIRYIQLACIAATESCFSTLIRRKYGRSSFFEESVLWFCSGSVNFQEFLHLYF